MSNIHYSVGNICNGGSTWADKINIVQPKAVKYVAGYYNIIIINNNILYTNVIKIDLHFHTAQTAIKFPPQRTTFTPTANGLCNTYTWVLIIIIIAVLPVLLP